MLCHLQGSNPVVFFAEVQYVENPGCDQYGIKKAAEREQMKNYNLYIYFLHFCFDFFDLGSTFLPKNKRLSSCVGLSTLTAPPNPLAPYAGES